MDGAGDEMEVSAPPSLTGMALGPGAARLVGKDTSNVFKRIDEMQRKDRKF